MKLAYLLKVCEQLTRASGRSSQQTLSNSIPWSRNLRRRWVSDSSNSRPLEMSRSRGRRSEGPDPPKAFDAGAMLLLVIPVSTFGLGTWQVFRWQWKLGKIEELESKTAAAAVELPGDLTNLEELEYKRVKLRGKFDYQHEAIIGPRSLYKDGPHTPKEGIVKRVRNESGYYLVTPFKVTGRDLTVLVNRGWIPNRKDMNHRPIPEDKEVEITAVVRKTEPRPVFVSDKTFSGNHFLYRDITKMAHLLGTDTIFLDLNTAEGVDLSTTFPVPGQTRVTLRNEHVSYFVTWYSLSAITAYMWHRRFILKKALV